MRKPSRAELCHLILDLDDMLGRIGMIALDGDCLGHPADVTICLSMIRTRVEIARAKIDKVYVQAGRAAAAKQSTSGGGRT